MENPWRYVPHLEPSRIPDAYKPIGLNEYDLPERIFFDPSLFPLRYGDMGNLVLDYQTARNWKGGASGMIVDEDGFFGDEMATWVQLHTGQPTISLDEFTSTIAAFPPLAELYPTPLV